jgi:hypothetical protein
MTPDRADRILHEYDASRDPAGDPELDAVKTALFLEDVFGITLSDAEIDPDVLGTAAGIRAVLERKTSAG